MCLLNKAVTSFAKAKGAIGGVDFLNALKSYFICIATVGKFYCHMKIKFQMSHDDSARHTRGEILKYC